MPLEKLKLPAPDTRLILHENKIYKLKMTYDWGDGPPFLPCLPRQLHNEVEQVIRALLHVQSFDSMILQTKHFQMTCLCSKWRVAEMLSFTKDNKPCKPHSMVYEISVGRKPNDQSSEKATSNQSVKQSTTSKENPLHQPLKDSSPPAESSHINGTRKTKEINDKSNKRRKSFCTCEDEEQMSTNSQQNNLTNVSPSLRKKPEDRNGVEDVHVDPSRDPQGATPPQEQERVRRSPRKQAKQGQQGALVDGSVSSGEKPSKRRHEVSKRFSPSGNQNIRERLRSRRDPSSREVQREATKRSASPKRSKMALSRNPCISSSSSNTSGGSNKRSLRKMTSRPYHASPTLRALRRTSSRSARRRRILPRTVKTPIIMKQSPTRKKRRSSFGMAIESFVNNFL